MFFQFQIDPPCKSERDVYSNISTYREYFYINFYFVMIIIPKTLPPCGQQLPQIFFQWHIIWNVFYPSITSVGVFELASFIIEKLNVEHVY